MKNISLENEMLEGLNESEVAAIRKQVEALNAKIEKARVAKIKRAEKANKIISEAVEKNFSNLTIEIAEAIVKLIESNLSDLLATVPEVVVKSETTVKETVVPDDSSDVDSDSTSDSVEEVVEEVADESDESADVTSDSFHQEEKEEKAKGFFGRF